MKTGYKNSIILTVSYFIILIQIIRIMRSNVKIVSQIARDLNLTAKIICTLMNESYEDKKTGDSDCFSPNHRFSLFSPV